ncbi:MAG: hypothetical protein AAF696_29920 [Bacteroidota bacterium]
MKELITFLCFFIPYAILGQSNERIYFENNAQVIDLSIDSSLQSFELMDTVLQEHEFFFAAEQHWKAVNSQLQFRFLQYLHQRAGVRNLLLEGGYSYAYLINKYLKTGDGKLLDKVLQDIPVCPKDQRKLFERIRNYNLELAAEDRIEVHGIDLEHSPILALQSLNNLLPEKEVPKNISHRIEKLLKLHHSPQYDEVEVKRFFRKLDRDLIGKETAYRKFWGEDFELFEMIVQNTIQGYGFNLFSATLFKRIWQSREERMYKNFLVLQKRMKAGKYFAQFGALHTDIKTSSRWEFPSLANRLNYTESSPVQGRVLTISRYFRKLKSDYQKPVEYNKLENMVELAEGNFKNSIVLLSMIGNQTPFPELSKTFQYIILIDPDLEKEGCE